MTLHKFTTPSHTSPTNLYSLELFLFDSSLIFYENALFSLELICFCLEY